MYWTLCQLLSADNRVSCEHFADKLFCAVCVVCSSLEAIDRYSLTYTTWTKALVALPKNIGTHFMDMLFCAISSV